MLYHIVRLAIVVGFVAVSALMMGVVASLATN